MTIRLLLLNLLILTAPLLAQPDPAALFEKANQAMEAEKYQEALDGYRQVLTIERTTGVLWNAGLAAYFLDKGDEARDLFKELKEAAPDDLAVRAKLIQAYQMTGETKARDAERDELKALWKAAPETSEARQKKEFCRDQFVADGHRVYVMEQFELEHPRAVLYLFVTPENPKRKGTWLSLGTYQFTTDYMRETGAIGPEERAYHLDGYGPGAHQTYDIYTEQPSYEETKAKVIGILEGRTAPISSTTKKGDDTTITVPAP